ncbi:MAG: Biopolymer transport protein ExbB [Alphaproteobacteria bacterium MarineAlpha5_Bin8]|nr:MAG: Biopolymer transport protein ExbB [Alphaproteobacteria bacterium MarineAlpha5_Bin7]PPR48395.1 MAG: Biopolymer transport protein ExbB [Alphaproteobacteria bacterium MarineAlpha5_Bin8]PPR54392.1 MAG: Biopolymer transport protein ExbB [Alphaproteobacteria bacterium MarineAlpha5_Bin6]|tara:strand:+ start:1120 stop:1839 length:720 start_codon:yes stop_codon:yes gene_type:complete
METVVTSEAISSAAIDFSLLSLFLRADLVVKSVIIILALASIYSWTIIIAKLIKMKKLRQLENEFDEIFWSGNSFEDLYETFNYNQEDPKSKIYCAAMNEWKKSKQGKAISKSHDLNSLKERMHRSMLVTFNKESELIEKNLTFLATSGSTAPFIGLFGTVWGIMNSFQSIAIAQNTNLAVVAPGIAEALFATALGLFVAIPAVVAYNKLTSDLSKYFMSLESFIDEFTTIFFRQLENK